MKNNQEKINKNKWKYIVASALVLGVGVTGILYLKNEKIKVDKEHIAKGEDSSIKVDKKINNTPINIVDIKDFARSNKLVEEDLSKFVSYGKLLNNDFIYLKRDTSFRKLELYRVDKNDNLVQYLNIEGDRNAQIDLNSIIELSDESLLLQTEEYISDTEGTIYSLYRYDKDGELKFSKTLDDNCDILNLYSFNDMDGFISRESNLNGDTSIIKYDFNGEEIFRYKTKNDYISNIDIIFKDNKITLISKDEKYNIVELDENGKEISKIELPYDNIRVNKLTATSDNGYIVGFTKEADDNSKEIESYYTKIDSKGKKEWDYSDRVNSFTRSIHEINDGYIIFSNDFYPNTNGEESDVLNLYSISKIDKVGKREWIKHINISDETNSSIFTPNGEYTEEEFLIISGVLEDFENNAYHIMLSVDKDGNISSVVNDDIDAVG